MFTRLLALLALGLVFSACAVPAPMPLTSTPSLSPTVSPEPTAMPTPPVQPFRVIAYVTDAIVLEVIPFEKLTHINFAFLIPNDDGTFASLNNAWKVKELVKRSHASGVQVLISIGGWGWDAQFEEMAASSEKRALFIREALKVVNEYGFDGVDVDWEYPDPGQSAQNYLALITELRAALPDKLLTTAVIAFGDEYGLGVPAETFALFDFVNVMTYDGIGHATLEQFQSGLDYWLGRGVPPEKLVMGLPFYSRPGEVSYRKLVQNDPAAAQADIFTYNGSEERYNGIPMVRKKTLLAFDKASGIMFWTLEHDATGDASLLNAINETIASYKP